jgi:predicted nucleic acid-binding protein
MFLLDTMVVSDLGKARLAPELSRWSEAAEIERSFLSVVSVEEIELGILLKERRDPAAAARLRRWFEGAVLGAFEGRILPVDLAVARRAAALHVDRTRPASDARIAATALVHGLTVATRNLEDFEGTGVHLVNPYTDPEGPDAPP